jgi:aminopeptidase-like protein
VIPERGSSAIGQSMHQLIAGLYSVCRSITGNGVRETLGILQGHIPLDIHEVASGTEVFDWTVPKEWNIRDAYVKNERGCRVIDFQKSNLHVVSYSRPVQQRMMLAELKDHLFTLPDRPEWIPYRTSYYKETWGFCLSHKQLQELVTEGPYEICIDATIEDGHLTYGEYCLPGATNEEVLISCHVCHPSLCNDNLSGVALAVYLAKALQPLTRRYTYRFLFIPGTIGSITWLSVNENRVSQIKHGLVLAGVGDRGHFTYKKSRRGQAEIDRAFAHVLKCSNDGSVEIDFFPYGYDERQYCSPGFDLPVGCAMRTPFGQYPEYHTSADNLDFVSPDALADSFDKCLASLSMLEKNGTYVNQNPKCEPRLGKRGLYQSTGGKVIREMGELPLLWVLNFSDGTHSLLDIAERANLPFDTIRTAASVLEECSLICPLPGTRVRPPNEK